MSQGILFYSGKEIIGNKKFHFLLIIFRPEVRERMQLTALGRVFGDLSFRYKQNARLK